MNSFVLKIMLCRSLTSEKVKTRLIETMEKAVKFNLIELMDVAS